MKTLATLTVLCLLSITLSFGQDQASGDFLAYIDGKISAFPGSGGNEFSEPTIGESNTWNTAITEVMNAQYAQAHTTLAGLGYRLVEYTDNVSGSVYYIVEKLSSASNYWGIYVFNPAPDRSTLIIQGPHPKYDTNTGSQAAYVFREIGARALFLSGTHRCNDSTASSCSGTTSACGNSEAFRISDNPHNTNTIFHTTTENLFDAIPNSIFIQLHGFGKESSDPYVILSNGTPLQPLPLDFLARIRDELFVEDNVLTFKIAHLDNWTRLTGTTNVQGRMINASADPCLEISTGNNGRFIHIEQEKTRLRNDVSGWTKMSNALARVFVADGGPNTVVTFSPVLSSADETAGTTTMTLEIQNPSGSQATTVEVVLTTGDPADVNNYTTQTITFPAGSSASQTLDLTITDDQDLEGDETLLFSLQNPAGGNSATIGTMSAHALSILDDDDPDLVVNEFMPWPAGSDASAGGATRFDSNGDGTYSYHYDEYVELVNKGTAPADISGWKINDGADRHIFPANTIVPPGGAIVVFGGGTPSGSFGNSIVQTASESTSLGLVNTGDQVFIKDGADVTQLSFTYGPATRPVAFVRSPDITGDFVPHPLTSAYSNEDGTNAQASPGVRQDGTPFGNLDTGVQFASSGTTVGEAAGQINITLSISNPSSTQATSVDLVLTAGDPADIDNYTTQTVTFPAGSSTSESIPLTITDDLLEEATETLTFTLQNITGGTNASIASPATFDLSITDNDFSPVADFTADLTSIEEGGTVSFTDQSTNGPSSWSWSFPGGTPSASTAQHPQVTYAVAGIYDVTLTATNAVGNDVETKVGYITVTVPGNCATINFEDFESGWGIWNDGGNDAWRSSGDASYANSGSFTVRLQDNTNTSVMTTDNLDLTAYSSAEISFSYITRSMDNANEDFWLQISTDGGNSFTTIEEWNLNDEFVNDQRYNETVSIDGIAFTASTQFRFRCDASANNDQVFIDDVEIRGCGAGQSSVLADTPNTISLGRDEIAGEGRKILEHTATVQHIEVGKLEDHAEFSTNLHPNPASQIANLDLMGKTDQEADVYLFNMHGQVIQVYHLDQVENNRIALPLTGLTNGVYAVIVKSGQRTVGVHRLMVFK
ncbi:lamin tail domain-containing protein [Flavilitoribacter nigricans]|uniref:PKD domain-containing protein n=1 Tax=Flavilitoribacter nigricans (strain ATCC 23147 / DSM 23189 / NBRC 102662 / NCIMB 1420 / SS-2) TaxID=1122177 RepID=A0A2D0N7G0_FLAN2|nr:lamin tail domain-containing protein [Flavilitoribacter nigricans]PHN04326.1 hypothetical protein CRP01_22450 [Flavilitoribacter nigricans DSM 23189 = NBRC 102662]